MEHPNNNPKFQTRKVSEIQRPPYGFYIPINGQQVPVVSDPTPEEICQAIEDDQLEARGFQSHKAELEKEWNESLPGEFRANCIEYGRRCRVYHAQRIAFFVVNGWDGDPIELKPDGVNINDGLHRL